MRGVPSSGKSFTSKALAGKKGTVIETDSFHGVSGKNFKYQHDKKDAGRDWTFKQLKKAIKKGKNPIVIDRGNNPSEYDKKLMTYVINHGYNPELMEPISEWWTEIQILLKYRDITNGRLDHALWNWAVKLEKINEGTHHVKAKKIFDRLMKFKINLSIYDFLYYGEKDKRIPIEHIPSVKNQK